MFYLPECYHKTPDLFVAINTSAGVFSLKELINLSNIGVHYITSNADHGNVKLYELLEQSHHYLKNCNQIIHERFIHIVFEQVQFSIPALKDVIDTQRDPYPL